MRNPLIVALDESAVDGAMQIAKNVGDAVGGFKVGLTLWATGGPDAVRAIDAPVFLDLKLHDIPHQVEGAVRALGPLKPSMLTVHALGGRAMMEAAAAQTPTGTALLAVTILTSLHDHALTEMHLPPIAEAVPVLAELAVESGCDGIVCSAADLDVVRNIVPGDFLIVTPGIRPAGADVQDQARVVTPKQALGAGATHIVVGRPITQSADPRSAADAILEEIRS